MLLCSSNSGALAKLGIGAASGKSSEHLTEHFAAVHGTAHCVTCLQTARARAQTSGQTARIAQLVKR